MRIINDHLWDSAQAEMKRRAHGSGAEESPGKLWKKYLLNGLIKCSCCSSNYVISGKDYCRCAGRSSVAPACNALSVRKDALQTAALSILQYYLFNEEQASLSAKTFNCEIAKIFGNQADRNQAHNDRVEVLDTEIANLLANLLTGVVSTTLAHMLVQRGNEKGRD